MNPVLNKTQTLPLGGHRIVVTRARDQAAEFVAMLEARGAEVIALPLIQIAEPDSWGPADLAMLHLSDFDLLIFTSVNAVEKWVARAKEKERPAVEKKNRVIAVGETTAARLKHHGLPVEALPEKFSAEGLLEKLDSNLKGQKILLPRGDLALEELPQGLKARGAEVLEVVVYRTLAVKPEIQPLMERMARNEIDVITFASPSAVHRFVESIGKDRIHSLPSTYHVASLGPSTSAALREHGFTVAMEATLSTLESLTAAIVQFYSLS